MPNSRVTSSRLLETLQRDLQEEAAAAEVASLFTDDMSSVVDVGRPDMAALSAASTSAGTGRLPLTDEELLQSVEIRRQQLPAVVGGDMPWGCGVCGAAANGGMVCVVVMVVGSASMAR